MSDTDHTTGRATSANGSNDWRATTIGALVGRWSSLDDGWKAVVLGCLVIATTAAGVRIGW